ncbi:MAG: sugar phosphate isomerase/epimerase [Fidelibacterota bacterium]|nr:MAG: sugar phosphate isomerase/epimerase [Candidatus Neomarinimicrobiota bacterium]
MKLSIVLSTQPASFSALAYKGQIAENIAKIKNLGYDGVELAVRDPAALDVSELKSILAEHRLPVPAIGTGQAFGEEGLSFTHPDAHIRRKAIDRIKSHMELADGLGAVVIIGLVRGKTGLDTDGDRVEQWLAEALTECASENKSVRLAIEPINRYETGLVNTVASGLDLIDTVGLDNIGLLLDTFHMNIEEPSIIESMVAARDRLFHFHVADSNRWHPGAGHIDFAEIIHTLNSIGYQDFVSAEILPLPDPDTAAIKTVEYMREMVT